MKSVFNKLTIVLLIGIFIIGCTKIPETTKKQEQIQELDLTGLTQHKLFNGEAEIALDKNFERFNIAELIAVTKKQPKTSFINRIFNEEQLQLAEYLGANYYVFIDTSTYDNIMHLEKLDKLLPINKEGASIIGGLFKKKIQVSDPGANVQVQSAKFGAQPTYTYGYYKMISSSPFLTSYSNHYAISSKKSSYILYNISLQNHDFSQLKNQLSFP